jgi:hypothetical protein
LNARWKGQTFRPLASKAEQRAEQWLVVIRQEIEGHLIPSFETMQGPVEAAEGRLSSHLNYLTYPCRAAPRPKFSLGSFCQRTLFD